MWRSRRPVGRLVGIAPDAVPVRLPIGLDEVHAIASAGFPLKEPLPTVVLRNKRITIAYADLAEQLTELLACRGAEVRAGNWCTFASWSSRTIGCSLDPDDVPERLRAADGLPMRSPLSRLVQRVNRSETHAVVRALAAGNRFIFLEVGTAVASFVRAFARDEPTEERWSAYWGEIEAALRDLAALDPSWVPTVPGRSDELRMGMRQYFEALAEPDPDVKSERILAANILLAAYEQHRAEGYVLTSLSARSSGAFRRLLSTGSGRAPDPVRRAVDTAFARLVTRRVVTVLTPYEVLRVGHRLEPPLQADGTRSTRLFAHDVGDVSMPLLQALISRFDLGDTEAGKRGARNWQRYGERMHFIVNFFRSRHTDPSFRTEPLFDPADRDLLLAGRLPRPLRRP